MSALTPSPDAIEVVLAKLLSSAAFRDRPHLRRFLTYVVQHSVSGDVAFWVCTIGLEIFDRGGWFDPRCDSIVRVEALNLRKALRVLSK